MKIASSAALVFYGTVMLVIVSGQSTTDDDHDKDKISKLIDTVEELRDRIRELEGQLTALIHRINI